MLRPIVHRPLQDQHVRETEESEGSLGLVGMDEVGDEPAPAIVGSEELTHDPVPVDDPEVSGELICVLEPLDGRLQDPELPVVVQDDLLAEAIVPQAQYGVH
jgi:hypothetical protein